jgi:hypothetical protein
VSTWDGELEYWSSEIAEPKKGVCVAHIFSSNMGNLNCDGSAGLDSIGFAIRPVFVE